MENICVCNICGRSFENTASVNICKNCIEQDISDFNKIRDYLFIHPKAKMLEVSTNLDIPIRKIKRFLRESRLEIVEKDNPFLKCDNCGKPICLGTLCEDCKDKSAHDFKSTFTGSSTTKGKINFKVASGKKH